MSALLLDGTKIAAEIKTEVGAEAKALINAGVRPGLAAVLVGNDPASRQYVRNKQRYAAELGFASRVIEVPPQKATTAHLLEIVDGLTETDETPAGWIVTGADFPPMVVLAVIVTTVSVFTL